MDAGVLPDLGPQLPQALGQGALAGGGAGDHKGAAFEGQSIEPVKGIGQGAHPTHHTDGGAHHLVVLSGLGQGGQGGADAPLGGGGAPLHDGGGGVGVHARLQKPFTNLGQGGHTHEEHQGATGGHQGVKVDVQRFPRPLVSGDNVQGGAAVPVGHRNAAVGGHRQGGGDPRHHLEGHLMLGQQLQLLTAPAKEKGVAALEAHHVGAPQGLPQENLVDLLLGHRVHIHPLTHVDGLGGGGDEGQN